MITVFDLDHTLFCKNASFEFGRFLYRQGVLSLYHALICFLFYCSHKWFFLSSDALHKKIFQHIFSGRELAEFRLLAKEFLNKSWNELINPELVSTLEKEKGKQKFCMILSNSPQFLVDEIGRRFGIEIAEGTKYLLDNKNRFVSVNLVMNGENKKAFIKYFVETRFIPTNEVTAYSDSFSDLPLLEFVGTAICVNPDMKLRHISTIKGWEIKQ